jgi:hypothetical protein
MASWRAIIMAVENAGTSSPRKPEFTDAQWKRLCQGALEDLRLDREQVPQKEPRTPEEILLSRLD